METATQAAFVAALERHWNEFGDKERQRAMFVYTTWAPSSEDARSALARLASEPNSNFRDAAIVQLLRVGPVAVPALLQVVSNQPELWTRLNAPLARMAPETTLTYLFKALEKPQTRQQPSVRRALVLATEQAGDKANAQWGAWLEASPSASAAAYAAEALNGAPNRIGLQQRLVTYAMPKVREFEDRWRLVRCHGSMPPNAKYDAWLEQTALHSQEWMLRSAALEALRARKNPNATKVATTLASDSYPRVSYFAARVLQKKAVAPKLPFLSRPQGP